MIEYVIEAMGTWPGRADASQVYNSWFYENETGDDLARAISYQQHVEYKLGVPARIVPYVDGVRQQQTIISSYNL